jgi:hypothetical protein
VLFFLFICPPFRRAVAHKLQPVSSLALPRLLHSSHSTSSPADGPSSTVHQEHTAHIGQGFPSPNTSTPPPALPPWLPPSIPRPQKMPMASCGATDASPHAAIASHLLGQEHPSLMGHADADFVRVRKLPCSQESAEVHLRPWKSQLTRRLTAPWRGAIQPNRQRQMLPTEVAASVEKVAPRACECSASLNANGDGNHGNHGSRRCLAEQSSAVGTDPLSPTCGGVRWRMSSILSAPSSPSRSPRSYASCTPSSRKSCTPTERESVKSLQSLHI